MGYVGIRYKNFKKRNNKDWSRLHSSKYHLFSISKSLTYHSFTVLATTGVFFYEKNLITEFRVEITSFLKTFNKKVQYSFFVLFFYTILVIFE